MEIAAEIEITTAHASPKMRVEKGRTISNTVCGHLPVMPGPSVLALLAVNQLPTCIAYIAWSFLLAVIRQCLHL